MNIDSLKDNGVSPVIGVILMVAITVALSATVAFVATDIGDNVNQNSRVGVSIEETESGVQISVTNMGNTESLQPTVNGTEVGPELTSAGDTVTITSPEDATVSVQGKTEGGSTTSVDSVSTTSDTTTGDSDSPSVVGSESNVSSSDGPGGGGTDGSTESVSEPSSTAPDPSKYSTILSDMSGSGTSSDPYVIMNDQQLQAMNYDKTAHYVLGQNIDASETKNWNSGSGFDPIGDGYNNSFTGNLDGQGYEISGLTINRGGVNHVALIGYMRSGGSISNIGVVDVDIAGNRDIGGLVGFMRGGSLTESYVAGGNVVSVEHYAVGGLVGANGGSITNSYAAVSVSGGSYPYGEDRIGVLIGTNGDAKNLYWGTKFGPEGIGSTFETNANKNINGLTKSEMQGDSAEENMSALDFDTIWTTVSGDYPDLQ